MGKKKQNKDKNAPCSMCAWCKMRIPEDSEVFALKARLRREIDLVDKEGASIPLVRVLDGRVV